MCQANIRLRVTYRLPFTTPATAAAGQGAADDAGGAAAQAGREPGIQGLRELVTALQVSTCVRRVPGKGDGDGRVGVG